MEAELWGRIVFQGSAFPTKNPAENGGTCNVPRNEWKTFRRVLIECNIPHEHIGYGDFGADCGEMSFSKKGGGGRPIPHLRYTTATDTIVVRGSKDGKQEVVMRDVFQRVLNSGSFDGQQYSYADDQIWLGAKGAISTGNASTWRELNMAHHITRVVRDLGAMSGVKFEQGKATPIFAQSTLF